MTDIAGIDIARIEIHLKESSVRVIADSTTEQPITLVNLTPLPDFFFLAVSGVASDWASFDKESANLFPNWSDIINLKVVVPAQTPDGKYILEISASSHTQENVRASITFELIVGTAQAEPVIASTPNHLPDHPTPSGHLHPAQALDAVAPDLVAPLVPGGEYPRLQIDLGFGQLYILCGQPGEQIVHLLNLTSIQQTFSVDLEGLPPQWLSINPPTLNLSPNWSEAVSIKIEVPGDAVPGRYLIGVKAVPTAQPEAISWTQFDLVIIQPNPSSPVNQPAAFIPATPPPDNSSQLKVAPVASHSPTHEVPPVIEAAPVSQEPAPPTDWTGPTMPPPAPEINREEPKPRSGLFGRKNKKKAEPIEPVMYAPSAPTPLIIPPVRQPEPVETPPALPQDRTTNKLWSAAPPRVIKPALAAPVVENEAPPQMVQPASTESLTVEAAEPILINPVTLATSEYISPNIASHWLFSPAAPAESPATVAANDIALENQLTEAMPVAQPEVLTPAQEQPVGPAETGVEIIPVVEELPEREPVNIKTDNFELNLETSKIGFELGLNAEQKVSLVNLMRTPAFFELHVEGFPEEWYSFSYSKLNLFPNWKEEVYFRLEAPTKTVPGLFTGKLVVFCSVLPDEKVEVELTVNVFPSDRLSDQLYRSTGAGLPVKLPENARIELALDTNNLSLVPGESLEQLVSLVNYSPIPDLFELKLDGLLEPWYHFSTSSLNLFPNWNEQFYLLIALPLTAVPGLYPLRLMVKGQNYPELNTEQSILLQVLPPLPVIESPSPEPEPEAMAELPVVVIESAAITVEENEKDEAPAQSFSFASFFQKELAPAPAPQIPAVAPENAASTEVYTQPTTGLPGLNEGTAPVSPYQPQPRAEFAPQTSLAGLIPVFTPQEEAPAPEFIPVEPPPMTVAPPHKRTLWQKVSGQGKQDPTPALAKIDESVYWRAAPQNTQGEQDQTQAWKNDQAGQAKPAGNFQPIGGPSLQPQAGQRTYTPISAGAGEVARVQITLEKPHMTIVAGDSAAQQIFMMNLTSLPDNFELTIEGLPGNWFKFENSTLNLFPNWNEHTELTINISEKVKPDLYKGRIIASATAQTGVRAVMPIEIEVLAPLVVQARLQPHLGKGYKAHYELLLRNRSMSEGLMTLQWSPRNEFSMGEFTPPQVVLAPGQIQHIKLQVMLRKKTPSDQARQAQPFEVMVQPQWTVAQLPVVTASVTVEGEYSHRSRWVFLQRHPVLFTFITIILVVALLWNLLLLPFIQNTLLLVSTDKISYSNVASKVLIANQQGFNQQVAQANPFLALFPTDVKFIQESQRDSKGVIEIRMQAFVFDASIRGTLQVDAVKGDLLYVASNRNQLGSFPWMFIPPNKVVEKLNAKLKAWLKNQNPPQRLDDVYVEGNTLFLKLKNCQIGEVACA